MTGMAGEKADCPQNGSSIYMLIELLCIWSLFDEHLHGTQIPHPSSIWRDRSTLFFPSCLSHQFFPSFSFQVSDLPINPLATAHESGNNFTSGNFSFPTNYVTMCTTVKISHVGGCLSQLSERGYNIVAVHFWVLPT